MTSTSEDGGRCNWSMRDIRQTSFKWLIQWSGHQDAGKQLSNFRFQGTNKKSNVFSEQGWAGRGLPQRRHLISFTKKKGRDTFRESSVKQAAFQERWTKAAIIPPPQVVYCSSLCIPQRENDQSHFIKHKSTNLTVTFLSVSNFVF